MAFAAGGDQHAEPFTPVELTAPGAASWTQIGGVPVTLAGAGPTATFTAPPTQAGNTLTFRAATPATADLIVPTPGFETGIGWSGFHATGVQDTTHIHSGGFAMKCVPTGLSGDVGCTSTEWAPSTAYTMHVWMYLEAIPGRALSWYASCHDAADVATTLTSPTVPSTLNTWFEFVWSFTTTADLVLLRNGIILSGSSSVPATTVWVDDVTIVGPAATPQTDTVDVHVRPHPMWRRLADDWTPVRLARL